MPKSDKLTFKRGVEDLSGDFPPLPGYQADAEQASQKMSRDITTVKVDGELLFAGPDALDEAKRAFLDHKEGFFFEGALEQAEQRGARLVFDDVLWEVPLDILDQRGIPFNGRLSERAVDGELRVGEISEPTYLRFVAGRGWGERRCPDLVPGVVRRFGHERPEVATNRLRRIEDRIWALLEVSNNRSRLMVVDANTGEPLAERDVEAELSRSGVEVTDDGTCAFALDDVVQVLDDQLEPLARYGPEVKDFERLELRSLSPDGNVIAWSYRYGIPPQFANVEREELLHELARDGYFGSSVNYEPHEDDVYTPRLEEFVDDILEAAADTDEIGYVLDQVVDEQLVDELEEELSYIVGDKYKALRQDILMVLRDLYVKGARTLDKWVCWDIEDDACLLEVELERSRPQGWMEEAFSKLDELWVLDGERALITGRDDDRNRHMGIVDLRQQDVVACFDFEPKHRLKLVGHHRDAERIGVVTDDHQGVAQLHEIDPTTGTQLGRYDLRGETKVGRDSFSVTEDGKWWRLDEQRFEVNTGRWSMDDDHNAQIVAIAATDELVASIDMRGKFIVRHWRDGQICCRGYLPFKHRAQLRFAPDARHLGLMLEDSDRFWRLDTQTGELKSTTKNGTHAIDFDAGGRLWTSHPSGRVRCWTFDEVGPVESFELGSHALTILSVSDSGDRLLGMDARGNLYVCEVATAEVLVEMESNRKMHAALSPNGQTFVAYTKDEGTALWDATTGEPIAQLVEKRAKSAAYSSDGSYVAVGRRGCVYLADATTGEALCDDSNARVPGQLHGHVARDDVQVTFSPDGSRLVSGGGRSVLVWDVDVLESMGWHQ